MLAPTTAETTIASQD